MRYFILILFLLLTPCYAIQDFYHFSDPNQQSRFFSLTSQLRCLVCQNQNLAESNAPLANDLRTEIYKKIKDGKTDSFIVNYLTSRYGNYILYQPPFNAATWLLWSGPFLFLLICLTYLIFYLRKKSEIK